MNPMILGPVLDIGGKIIDRLFPDPAAKAAAELELLKLTQAGELQTVLAQLEINAKEAAHPSVFVAGWRPFVGWCCGAGLAYATIGHNLLAWAAAAKGWPVPSAISSLTRFLGSFTISSPVRWSHVEKKSPFTRRQGKPMSLPSSTWSRAR